MQFHPQLIYAPGLNFIFLAVLSNGKTLNTLWNSRISKVQMAYPWRNSLKTTSILQVSSLCLVVSLFTIAIDSVSAQSAAPPGKGSSQTVVPIGAISQLSTAFSGQVVVQRVQLSGTVNYYAGSLKDSGTVSLTATNDGSSQMQLVLDSTGQYAETQTGNVAGARCQWSGANEVSHNVDIGNCWRPALWFCQPFPFNLRYCLQNRCLPIWEQAPSDLAQQPTGTCVDKLSRLRPRLGSH